MNRKGFGKVFEIIPGFLIYHLYKAKMKLMGGGIKNYEE